MNLCNSAYSTRTTNSNVSTAVTKPMSKGNTEKQNNTDRGNKQRTTIMYNNISTDNEIKDCIVPAIRSFNKQNDNHNKLALIT